MDIKLNHIDMFIYETPLTDIINMSATTETRPHRKIKNLLLLAGVDYIFRRFTSEDIIDDTKHLHYFKKFEYVFKTLRRAMHVLSFLSKEHVNSTSFSVSAKVGLCIYIGDIVLDAVRKYVVDSKIDKEILFALDKRSMGDELLVHLPFHWSDLSNIGITEDYVDDEYNVNIRLLMLDLEEIVRQINNDLAGAGNEKYSSNVRGALRCAIDSFFVDVSLLCQEDIISSYNGSMYFYKKNILVMEKWISTLIDDAPENFVRSWSSFIFSGGIIDDIKDIMIDFGIQMNVFLFVARKFYAREYNFIVNSDLQRGRELDRRGKFLIFIACPNTMLHCMLLTKYTRVTHMDSVAEFMDNAIWSKNLFSENPLYFSEKYNGAFAGIIETLSSCSTISIISAVIRNTMSSEIMSINISLYYEYVFTTCLYNANFLRSVRTHLILNNTTPSLASALRLETEKKAAFISSIISKNSNVISDGIENAPYFGVCDLRVSDIIRHIIK